MYHKTMKPTNFDRYLASQLKDPVFAELFRQAGEDWDIALQLSALREKAGLGPAGPTIPSPYI